METSIQGGILICIFALVITSVLLFFASKRIFIGFLALLICVTSALFIYYVSQYSRENQKELAYLTDPEIGELSIIGIHESVFEEWAISLHWHRLDGYQTVYLLEREVPVWRWKKSKLYWQDGGIVILKNGKIFGVLDPRTEKIKKAWGQTLPTDPSNQGLGSVPF